MNNDQLNIETLYGQIIEEAKKKLSPAQKKLASAAPPPDEITGDDFKALKKKKKVAEGIEAAYEQILEASATDKVVNKKLARRYYKAVRSLLKAEHGSKDYQKLKDEKEDIVKIVNDHGKTIADLDALLTKKEKEEVAGEAGTDNDVKPAACTTCGGDHAASSCHEDGNVE